MNPFVWVWSYCRPYYKRLILASIFLLINAALIVVNPYLTGWIVDKVLQGGQSQLLVPILLTMIGITLFRTVIRYAYQILYEGVGQDATYAIRNQLYTQLNRLDFDYYNHHRVGDIMARMTGDTDAIRHFSSWVVYNIVECIIWFMAAILVMSFISWPLMLSLLVVTPFIFLLARGMTKEAMPRFMDIRDRFSKLNSMVEENISGNRVVKAFVREDYEIKKFLDLNDAYKDANMASAKVTRKYLPALDFLANSLTVITLLVGGALVIKDQMTLGDLVAFNGYLWMLNNPMRMSGWLINDVQRFQASAIKIIDILEQEPTIPVVEADQVQPIQGKISFQNVDFAFADAPDQPVLKNINFEIQAGQTLGILGETGSGKSTLIHLINRFYDPISGRVAIDDQDVKSYPVRRLRDSIATVMQDIFLFSDTIGENIAFGNPDVDPGFVHQMAQIADADHFISKMAQGYDTIVGERGVGLSGGQKQRISLARALVKNPSILILDDTTSAVDMETEAKIQEQLSGLTKKMTTIIIAHRISSVKDADLILLMSHGQIIEQGKHQDLVKKKGAYYQLYQKQLGLENQKGDFHDQAGN